MSGPKGIRHSPWDRRLRFWLWLAVAFALSAAILTVVGAPSPFLFAGVLAGGVCTLLASPAEKTPESLRRLALGVIGVQAGSLIDIEVARTVLDRPLLTIGSAAATLVITLIAGQLLLLSRVVTPATALFSSIAGGAAGVTAMAREINSDEAVIVSVQYLRVLFVVLSVPLVAGLSGVGAVDGGSGGTSTAWSGLPFTLVALLVGLVLARLLPFAASRLILPMMVATALAIGNVFPTAAVPEPILACGFGAVGLMVGLELTREKLTRIAHLMPAAVGMLTISLLGCAAVGVVLAERSGVSPLTGYLATTPGGLPAVTAIAVDTGTDVGLVIACQVLRLFLAILLGGTLASVLRRKYPERQETGEERSTPS